MLHILSIIAAVVVLALIAIQFAAFTSLSRREVQRERVFVPFGYASGAHRSQCSSGRHCICVNGASYVISSYVFKNTQYFVYCLFSS
jgi:hypothetical protein